MSKFKPGDRVQVVFYSGADARARVLDMRESPLVGRISPVGPFSTSPSKYVVHVEIDSTGHLVSFYEDYVRLVNDPVWLAAEEYEEIILAQELMACSK